MYNNKELIKNVLKICAIIEFFDFQVEVKL